ncbi:MAG: PIN domain-containing protein [Planctomycetes bacterium]|nr:PIN domain-containing protein [Planctomycetota bacterium]MBI3833035.1 PIN domain-containing protein [Planctomycetota bacterium]
MGPLKLPDSGTVYLDSCCVIYAVESVEPYNQALQPLWQTAASGRVELSCSALTLLEVLVKPIRERKKELENAFRSFLVSSKEIQLLPIGVAVIERAARIRAETGLSTPDAIHAATALEVGVSTFITNDPAFRRVPGLAVTLIGEG